MAKHLFGGLLIAPGGMAGTVLGVYVQDQFNADSERKISSASPNHLMGDIARVAATVLTEEGHAAATYFPTGPETLDMQAATARLSKGIGRKVRYLNLPTPVFRVLMRATGNSPWMAKGLSVQFADVVAGHHDIDPTFEIERLTGVPPRTFDDFIRHYRQSFVG